MRRKTAALVGVGAWVGVIGVATGWGRAISEAAGTWATTAVEFVAGVGLVVGAVWAGLKCRGRGWRCWAGLVVGAGVMGVLWAVQEVGIERLHLFLYGGLGLIGWWAAREWAIAAPALWAAGVCVVVGVADEIVQWLMPTRVGDLKDVVTNALAGAVVAGCAGVLGREKRP